MEQRLEEVVRQRRNPMLVEGHERHHVARGQRRLVPWDKTLHGRCPRVKQVSVDKISNTEEHNHVDILAMRWRLGAKK